MIVFKSVGDAKDADDDAMGEDDGAEAVEEGGSEESKGFEGGAGFRPRFISGRPVALARGR